MVKKRADLMKSVATETGYPEAMVKMVADSFLKQLLVALYQDTEHKVVLQNFLVLEWKLRGTDNSSGLRAEDCRVLEVEFASNLKRNVERSGMERTIEENW